MRPMRLPCTWSPMHLVSNAAPAAARCLLVAVGRAGGGTGGGQAGSMMQANAEGMGHSGIQAYRCRCSTTTTPAGLHGQCHVFRRGCTGHGCCRWYCPQAFSHVSATQHTARSHISNAAGRQRTAPQAGSCRCGVYTRISEHPRPCTALCRWVRACSATSRRLQVGEGWRLHVC